MFFARDFHIKPSVVFFLRDLHIFEHKLVIYIFLARDLHITHTLSVVVFARDFHILVTHYL